MPIMQNSANAQEDLNRTNEHPLWFTPLRLLLIFCFTNLMVYLDRGLIGSNGVNGSPPTVDNPKGTGIQGEFNLSYFQDGLLPAAFLVGLLVSLFVFSEAAKHGQAFRLLGYGMGIWCVATALCGLAPSYIVFLLSRMLVGVGEASFVALAAPFIDDFAPPAAKTRWMAIFYLCLPVGFALGYIVGGAISAAINWRAAFLLESVIMLPFVIFVLNVKPLHLAGTKPETGSASLEQQSWRTILREVGSDILFILRQRVWLWATAGFTCYVAVLGVYAYWGPRAGREIYFPADAASPEADLVFGGVTVLTGVLGSLLGGFCLDKVGSSLRNATLICMTSCLVGAIFMFITFLGTHAFSSFMVVFGIGQTAIFLLQAPMAVVFMWSVPPAIRPLSISLNTLIIHLLGDVPSPAITGLLQEKLAEGKSPSEAAEQWRTTMSIITSLLILSVVAFGITSRYATPDADFRDKVKTRRHSRTEDVSSQKWDDDRSPLLAHTAAVTEVPESAA